MCKQNELGFIFFLMLNYNVTQFYNGLLTVFMRYQTTIILFWCVYSFIFSENSCQSLDTRVRFRFKSKAIFETLSFQFKFEAKICIITSTIISIY